jgi:Domain of unknown function (DUF3850)
MKVHVVKSWPEFFSRLAVGTRTHELRRNDRDYQEGDVLELHEYNPALMDYTGRVCTVQITSITSVQKPCAVSKEALHTDFCILSVRKSQIVPLEVSVRETTGSSRAVQHI